MYLQSYIYRAVKTMQWFCTDDQSVLEFREKDLEVSPRLQELLGVIACGLQDVKWSARLYRGATSSDSSVTKVEEVRCVMEELATVCSEFLGVVVPDNDVAGILPSDSAEAVRRTMYICCLRGCGSPKALGRLESIQAHMQRAGWSNWREGKAFCVKQFLPDMITARTEVHLPRAPLKRVARYNTLEASAIYNTACMQQCTYDGVAPVFLRASWLSVDATSIVVSGDKTGYAKIFKSDVEEDYTQAVLRYWAYLYKLSQDASVEE